MNLARSSGILLHPTSLPGRFGIGDLGPEAYRFVDFLTEAGQKLWEVLPLGPIGRGNSPYQSLSAFAGNPLLISPEKLAENGYLSEADWSDLPPFPDTQVDFDRVIAYKHRLLRIAYERFKQTGFPRSEPYKQFEHRHARWLEPFARFMVMKSASGGVPWNRMDRPVPPDENEIGFHKFTQYEFFRQWFELKQRCRERGISILGDLCFYVEHDSADVWASPELFQLDERGDPVAVGGVPPDYFSATGQLWGNPVYHWERLEQTGYRWWIERLRSSFDLVDMVRLDHFRGFEGFWEVPAGESTAMNGKWVKGPGAKLFEAARNELGDLPIVAENLGVITEDVEALRRQFSFPGMSVLQFAFGGDSTHRPHTYERHHAAFTGTHDNDTTQGWWASRTDNGERERALAYLGGDGRQIHWSFIRAVMTSVADLAVIPLQDLLGLGHEARMNVPGIAEGNWGWRYPAGVLNAEIAGRLRYLTELTDR